MKRLKHPEFTLPASLAIVVGLSIAVVNGMLHPPSAISWVLSVYLIVTGLGLFGRRWAGTVLLGGGLIVLLMVGIGRLLGHGVDPAPQSLARLLIGLVWMASMVGLVLAQIRSLRGRAVAVGGGEQTQR